MNRMLLLSCTVGYLIVQQSCVDAFSASSSFLGGESESTRSLISSTTGTSRAQHQQQSTKGGGANLVMYGDGPNQELNAWSVIATTERWISDTLKSSNQLASSAAASSTPSLSVGGNNPYARKEVSYYCETSKETSMIVAGIFRMLKEARERGEQHRIEEEQRADAVGSRDYSPKTMRQTQVIVVPGSTEFAESFLSFDKLITAVNNARRDARDYITDAMLEKIDNVIDMDGEDKDREWSVAINCAHLHPKFGDKTAEQRLQDMKDEADGEDTEIDVNLEQYKKARQAARRSPYPTVVLEVRATPPPDFNQALPPSKQKSSTYIGDGEEKITIADIQRLEALFGKSAVSDKSTQVMKSSGDEEFWNAIGNTIQEVAAVTPIKLAQQWITSLQDTKIIEEHTAFTETSTMYVDAAYEFVFTNIAMMTQDKIDGCRYYLVMPNFLSAAATSFEKFSMQVRNLLDCLPDLENKVIIETFHPEHINEQKRSPMPIFALQWKS